MNSYSLIGSIVHRGSADSGHYVCYSKRAGEVILEDQLLIKFLNSGYYVMMRTQKLCQVKKLLVKKHMC